MHVFYVHSAITYLVALAVIDRLNLAHEAVLILFARGFKVEASFRAREYPFPVGENYFGQLKRPWVFRRRARQFRGFIDALVGSNSMVWYLPQTSFSFFPLLRADRRMTAFSLIEEGHANYRQAGSSSLRKRGLYHAARAKAGAMYRDVIGRALVGCDWSPERSFFDDKYLECFVTQDAAMKGYPRRFILDLRSSPNVVALCTRAVKIDGLSGAYVFAFDASVEFGQLDASEFWSFWTKVTEYLDRKSVSQLFVKRHPAQIQTDWFWREFVQSTNSDGRKIIVLPDDLMLEVVFLRDPTVNLITRGSSLETYARAFGAGVVSLDHPSASSDSNA